MTEILFTAAIWIIPLILAIVFHEVAHGLTARMLGDPTASELGRLSLNPIKHVDPFGTIILPGMLALAKGPVFGWAKPVPVIKARLRNPRRDMMIVAAAGPGSNLVMGLVGAVLLGLLIPSEMASMLSLREVDTLLGLLPPVTAFVAAMLAAFVTLNVFLALFNLLPIPPFDGGHIVEGLLPRKLVPGFAALHRPALLIAILLIVVLPWISPSLNVVGPLIGPPVGWLIEAYLSIAAAIAGR